MKEYRFILDTAVEVIPLNVSKLKIQYAQENDEIFFRGKLNGKLVFRKGCCGGYETSSTGLAIVDGYEYIMTGKVKFDCKRFYIDIQQTCETGWHSIYKGYFTIYDCDIDEDNCVIEAQIETNDGYDCLLQKWDLKRNVYEFPHLPRHVISGGSLTSYFDVILIDIKEGPQQSCTDFEADYPDICTYGWVCSRGYKKGLKWRNVHIYVREMSTVQIGGNWTQDSNGRWGRPYDPNGPRFIHCGSDFNKPNPDPTNPHWKKYNNVNINLDYFWINTAGANVYASLPIQGNLRHDELMLAFLTNLQCAGVVSYRSTLFGSLVNPVTLENPNPLKQLHVNQKSNVVRHFANTPATKFELSLKDYMKYLKSMFQAYFYLDGSTLVMKHISEIGKGIGPNLTTIEGGRYLAGKAKYNYNRPDMAQREEWELGDDTGHFVEYQTNCANSQVIAKFSETQVFTDVTGMMGDEDSGLDGSVFLLKEPNTNLLLNNNSYLRLSNLIFNYWLHNRPALKGNYKRNKPFIAKTTPRFKEQVEINYPVCCNHFEPNNRITTQLGAGEVKSAEYSLLDRVIAVKLTHDE